MKSYGDKTLFKDMDELMRDPRSKGFRDRLRDPGSELTMPPSGMLGLRALFDSIPFDREVTFADGTKGVIKKPIQEPYHDKRLGGPTAFIYIDSPDLMWHLEFVLYQSGWEGTLK